MEETCKAIVFTAMERVEYLDIKMPQVEAPTDAILKVIACGVCGSDLHPFHGREDCAFGTAFGHECVGEVVSIGCEVSQCSIGDRCAVPFSVACGNCYYCANGMSARCQASQLLGWRDPSNGAGLHGAQSEYIRIPQANGSLYKLSADISNEEGILLGDIASTAAFAVTQAGLAGWDGGSSANAVVSLEYMLKNVLESTPTSIRYRSLEERGEAAPSDLPVFVVIGCGPVGLLSVAMSKLILHLRGYSDVCIFAVDTVPERLEFAKRWGAIPLLLNPSGEQVLVESSPSLTGKEICSAISRMSSSRNRSGKGADAVIECVGASSALRLAYDILAPGGIISSVGVHSTQFPFSPADIYDKNMTYKSGRCPARSLMDPVEKLMRIAKQEGNGLGCQMFLTDIITHKFALSDGPRAYDVFDKKVDGCIKAILYP